MSEERIRAVYRIETPHPLAAAAEALAGEQSSGTFVEVPGETPELRERFRARVVRITPLESVKTPSLPGSRPPRAGKRRHRGPTIYRRAEIEVSWPLDNIGTNLPSLVSTVQGNLYELSQFSGLKLVDLDLPAAFTRAYLGPRFSIDGTRDLCGVRDRPIIGTIIKPSVGLTPAATAGLVDQLAAAGIDFIKDDELMADPPHSPLRKRVEAVMAVIRRHADRTGRKVMFAFNITDELDAMRRHHDAVVRAGGTCVMVSLNSAGLPAVSALRRFSELPIHGHRNGWGQLSRHPYLGIEFAAYQKLWRLAGADHLHVNGLANKFCEGDDSVVRSIEACLAPLLTDPSAPPWRAFPVISSGQWGGQAPETHRRTKTIDVMYLAGGGIMAHPMGPGAGVRAMRQAWEAAVDGIALDEYARTRPELQATLEKFGGLRPSAGKARPAALRRASGRRRAR